MTGESCETCRFFMPNEQSNGEAVGDCRCHPPTTFMVVMPMVGSTITRAGKPQMTNVNMKFPAAWPFVQGKHWCGEFQHPIEKIAQRALPSKRALPSLVDAAQDGPGHELE